MEDLNLMLITQVKSVVKLKITILIQLIIII